MGLDLGIVIKAMTGIDLAFLFLCLVWPYILRTERVYANRDRARRGTLYGGRWGAACRGPASGGVCGRALAQGNKYPAATARSPDHGSVPAGPTGHCLLLRLAARP